MSYSIDLIEEVKSLLIEESKRSGSELFRFNKTFNTDNSELILSE